MAMPDEFVPLIMPADPGLRDAWWFIVSDYGLLVTTSGNTASIPFLKEPEKLGVRILRSLHLGSYRGHPCYAAEGKLPGENAEGAAFQEIRSLYNMLDHDFYAIGLTALHLIEWDKAHQFCGMCRGELKPRNDMRAKECAGCGRIEFPRISPAIIVLVEREDTLLLARSPRFRDQFYSVLAGFVDPGESLEEAVRREVREEVGINVKDITYFGSQPWPFPDSLMIGFTAQYESGELKIDGQEIIEAGWYRAKDLPRIPGKLSIARRLIDWFVEKHKRDFD